MVSPKFPVLSAERRLLYIEPVAGSEWHAEVVGLFPDARFDEPLAPYTTFKIGGPAECFVEPASVAELSRLVRFARSRRLPLLLIGFGSNLLVRDGGVRGITARLKGEFEMMEFLPGLRVKAGAAVRLPQLVLRCAEEGLAGAEPLVGVPGTVGGALIMNAGTRECEIGPLVHEARVLDSEALQEKIIPGENIGFSYRSSSLMGSFVLGATLQLKAGNKADIISRVQGHQQRRLRTQPVHTFNVGSIFKNPPHQYVARLIEELGFKGFAVGGARVSPVHANFIENFSRAKASDVLQLVERIREKVREVKGVDLELEIKVVGEA